MNQRQFYEGLIKDLPNNGVLVFGANTEGIHGAGVALIAKQKFGAVYGKVGYIGKSYGLITKDLNKVNHPSVSREEIIKHISKLYDFARDNPNLLFYVAYTKGGKNLNGYTDLEMASMFVHNFPPINMVFEREFFYSLMIGE